MPIPSPFHARTSECCTSLFWKEWAGHHAVRSYDTNHEREYFALRHAAGLIDVSPLYKYEIAGPDAASFLAYVTVRDIRRLKRSRVVYLCWCDDDGWVVDDGTVSRLGVERFRLTAAEPAGAWLVDRSHGYRVTIEESTRAVGALAVQGPASRAILNEVTRPSVDALRFFGIMPARLAGIDVEISRTGYTGDLGYEIWVRRERALDVWDALVDKGRDYRLQPVGLDALDVARIEAGFIMNGVDYFSANHCLIESRKSSPFEIGLGWTVRLDREPFLGQAALMRERARGSSQALVGLDYDWEEFEALHAEFGLPPRPPSRAWRDGVPVYDRGGRQVGQATSGTWSPLLKRNLALASVRAAESAPGTRLRIETTVEYQRRKVTATVVPTPFFDPRRKRS